MQPIASQFPDTCADEPIDPIEVLPRLQSAISMATIGDFGRHKIIVGTIAILSILMAAVGMAALIATSALSAIGLLAPFSLMCACLIGALSIRYRLKHEFNRRSFALADTITSATGICITLSTVLLGFISLESTSPLVTSAAILLFLTSCTLHLSVKQALSVARMHFEALASRRATNTPEAS